MVNFKKKNLPEREGFDMNESEEKLVAINTLERLIDREYAVAFRKPNRKTVHVRAVKEGAIVEAESSTVSEALDTIYEKVKRKTEAGS